ncbi:filamentous hemagglutinin N-terminal domain-containing protein, partial [Palleronia caenipelagi]
MLRFFEVVRSERFHRRLGRMSDCGFRLLLAALLVVQSVYFSWAEAQQIVLDPNGNVGFAPSVNNTRSAPVVNIARPNSGGVSKNRYSRFSVDQNGAVLNNSKNGAETSVAGKVRGNPNLSGGTADTIVNEVTSTAASSLTGTLEVAGDRADVIIANPNGITCDGCRFVNSSEVTLSTGKPIVDGSVVTLDVKTGVVRIGRGGLDGAATGVDGVNLVGRAVIVDGKLTAIEQITASGGAQRFNVRTRQASRQSGSGAAPEYAVDATEFGAMEAGRIQIIGNEEGLGVRTLGALSASSGDLSIRSQGDLTIRSGQAAGSITVDAAGAVRHERDLSATGRNIVIRAESYSSTERTGLYARNLITLDVENSLSLLGVSQSRSGVEITAGDVFVGSLVTTDGAFNLRARNGIEAISATVLAEAISLRTGGRTKVGANYFRSVLGMSIDTDSFHLDQDNVFDVPDLVDINVAGVFLNGADLRLYPQLDIDFGGDLENLETGVFAEDRLDLAVNGTLRNRGVLYGEERLELASTELVNLETGRIFGGDVRFDLAQDLSNDGEIGASGLLEAKLRDIVNSGTIVGDDVTLEARDLLNRSSGLIAANQDLSATFTGQGRNEGRITAISRLGAAFAGRFVNAGEFGANEQLSLSADVLRNDDLVFTPGDLAEISARLFDNAGRLESGGDIVVRAFETLSSGGEIEAIGRLFVDGGDVVLSRSARVVAGDIEIFASRVSSEGFVLSGADLVVSAETTAITAGQVLSVGDVEVRSGQIGVAAGSLLAAGIVTDDARPRLTQGSDLVLVADVIDVAGAVGATGVASVVARNEMTNSGEVSAPDLSVNIARLSNLLNGVLQGADTVRIEIGENLSNDGVIVSGGGLAINAANDLSNSGLLLADLNADLTAENLINPGQIISASSIAVTSTGEIASSGRLQAADDITLIAGDQISNDGILMSGDQAALSSQVSSEIIFGPSSATDVGALILDADDIRLGGEMIVSDPLTISTDVLRLSGTLYSGGDLSLSGKRIESAASAVTVAGVDFSDLTAPLGVASLTLNAASADLGGEMLTGGTATVQVTDLLTVPGALEAVGGDLVLSAGTLKSGAQSRLIAAGIGQLDILGDAAIGGAVFAGGDLSLQAGGLALITATDGAVGAGDRLAILASEIAVEGLAYGLGSAVLSASEGLTSSGLLESGGALELSA